MADTTEGTEAADRLESALTGRIDPGTLDEIAGLAQQVPRAEIGRLVHTSTPLQSAMLFRVLTKEEALDVFEDLPPAYQAELIGNLREPEVADIVEGLDPDDRAELFGELPAGVASRLMKGLTPDEREMTSAVLGYPKSAIGRYMSPEVLGIHEDWTAAQAMEVVRARIDGPETVYLLPVVGPGRVLRGVVSLRNLLAADEDTIIEDIVRDSLSTHALTDREEASREFLSHRLIAMPVTDQEERLVGILTMDDVLDIVDEEDAEDLARGSGTEPLDRSYLSSTIIRLVKSRIVWLLVLAVSAILTVQVLEVYEDRLDQVVVLALFIPLLTGTGGNTGNQAATTVTRALAVGEVRVRDLGRVIWRELRVGAVLGSVLGTLGFVVAGLVYGWAIGLVIGLTLLSVCIMAATVGGLMPIIAKKVGADPAVFSNPFISTFCDATGLILYFTIATTVLGLS
ncbi:magnesium transporter MgtE [Brevibacterium sediminis]|uniref:Magnesium transporter MgtE n=1 Tax=Brevibacterium sediminis TaxID=1857024 RepID=A0A5C4WZ66_9MICO|nr:magnesium transporter [Brevibacterium sediminis]TNM53690.1 magnesium transporter [Brevibacterium sediminis]GGC50927.1 magnesium transporter MgtE [Brevibacterium sediminis]